MSEQSAHAADAGRAGPGPGARLKAARERRGLDVGDVAESLHVQPKLIAAMESNEFGAFDAPVYAKGFLRKYAGYLGIPVDEVLAAYDALAAGPQAPTLIPILTVTPPAPGLGTVPPAAVLVVVAALLLIGISYWWLDRAPGQVVAPAAAPAGAESGPAAGAATDGEAAPATTLAPVPAPAAEPAGANGAAQVPPADGAARTAEAARAAGARHAAGAAAHEEVLVIHGVRECWAEVYSASGVRLFYDLVHPGETRSVPGPGPWRVFLGYADGARLSVGGRNVVVPSARRASETARFVVGRDGTAQ